MTGETETTLVRVAVDGVGVVPVQPTLENVLQWLGERRVSRVTAEGQEVPWPDLAPVAEQMAALLSETGAILPARGRVVRLREEGRERHLAIVIGAQEADAIGIALRGVSTTRPLSHDLMKSLLEAGGMRVQQVAVTRHEGETYYATITLRRPRGKTVEVDARPSDAIALALRAEAPMYVAEAVMAKWGVEPAAEAEKPPPTAER
jgi:bifunctional DNase/RNase